MPELLNKILNQVTFIKESKYKDESTKNKILSQIEIIDHKLSPKKLELISLLNRIVEKESMMARKLSGEINLDSRKHSVNSFYSESNLESTNLNKMKQSFDSNCLIVKDVQDNLKYIKKRQEELEEIKVISGQIKDLSGKMVSEVRNQGENLNNIIISVEETKETAKKAEFEIQISENESRKGSKRTLCIFLLVIFILASIFSVGILLYIGKN
jgi:hypothetical protein